MHQRTFSTPDLTTLCHPDTLGLACRGQHVTDRESVLLRTPTKDNDWCHRCEGHGTSRDTVIRRLAHALFGYRPTTLMIRLRRYKSEQCGSVWRHDTDQAAPARAKISRAGLAWVLRALVVDHATVSVIAKKLSGSWHTANGAIHPEGQRVLIDDPARFDNVAVIGIDEHVWRHTRRGDKYVTVIIDLTPIRDKTGQARLLDAVEVRSEGVLKTWLAAKSQEWRDGIDVVAKDGFTGFKTAAVEELPTALEAMDPFHVVKLAGYSLDEDRCIVQQVTTAWEEGRPILLGTMDPAHRVSAAHWAATEEDRRTVRGGGVMPMSKSLGVCPKTLSPRTAPQTAPKARGHCRRSSS